MGTQADCLETADFPKSAPNEAAMMLYVHLKGEAEEELGYASLDRIDAEDGVGYFLETLRAPLHDGQRHLSEAQILG